MKLAPEMTLDDVVHVTLRLDDYLIDLFRSMAENVNVPEVRDVFKNLLEMEEQERRQKSRNALDLETL